jgi:hypothetical protein
LLHCLIVSRQSALIDDITIVKIWIILSKLNGIYKVAISYFWRVNFGPFFCIFSYRWSIFRAGVDYILNY